MRWLRRLLGFAVWSVVLAAPFAAWLWPAAPTWRREFPGLRDFAVGEAIAVGWVVRNTATGMELLSIDAATGATLNRKDFPGAEDLRYLPNTAGTAMNVVALPLGDIEILELPSLRSRLARRLPFRHPGPPPPVLPPPPPMIIAKGAAPPLPRRVGPPDPIVPLDTPRRDWWMLGSPDGQSVIVHGKETVDTRNGVMDMQTMVFNLATGELNALEIGLRFPALSPNGETLVAAKDRAPEPNGIANPTAPTVVAAWDFPSLRPRWRITTPTAVDWPSFPREHPGEVWLASDGRAVALNLADGTPAREQTPKVESEWFRNADPGESAFAWDVQGKLLVSPYSHGQIHSELTEAGGLTYLGEVVALGSIEISVWLVEHGLSGTLCHTIVAKPATRSVLFHRVALGAKQWDTIGFIGASAMLLQTGDGPWLERFELPMPKNWLLRGMLGAAPGLALAAVKWRKRAGQRQRPG